MQRNNIRPEAIERVGVVNGTPQTERTDMPPTLSSNLIEKLKRFCEVVDSGN